VLSKVQAAVTAPKNHSGKAAVIKVNQKELRNFTPQSGEGEMAALWRLSPS
jgi:hypothetical protein